MNRWINHLPARARATSLILLYGLVGGLVAVAFMVGSNRTFRLLWGYLTELRPLHFLAGSLLVLLLTSLLSGWLMQVISPSAAGSGIPQLKAAYWKEFGVIPFRDLLVKFVGGVLTLGGGTSLGREGPTVFMAGGLAAHVAGWLGIDRRHRRQATAAGAAAGLAAAFNTPLAAISFVLEELLGNLNSRWLGSVALASVIGAFVVYALVGQQPSFSMPSVDRASWDLYLLVPGAAMLAALAGVVFQRASLDLRRRAGGWTRIPVWLRPALGALVTWAVGGAVYLGSGRLGVFGLGYDDLSHALADGLGWKIAGLLAVAKLVASIASYGTGGCGGIFSPTLFIGAMCGFFFGDVAGHWIPITDTDRLILAATGMSACFGCVVRAPFTAIMMIFEMTHQFGMVPALMLGTLISQVVARLAGKVNFYEAILEQDGHELMTVAPPPDFSGWRNLPVSALARSRPVTVTDLSAESLSRLLRQHPYRSFPVVLGGEIKGVVTRAEITASLRHAMPPQLEPPVVLQANQSLSEVEARLIESSAGLFLVAGETPGSLRGVFTLHDLLRAQAALLE